MYTLNQGRSNKKLDKQIQMTCFCGSLKDSETCETKNLQTIN